MPPIVRTITKLFYSHRQPDNTKSKENKKSTESTESNAPICKMAPELFEYVTEYLSDRDLLALTLVSRRVRQNTIQSTTFQQRLYPSRKVYLARENRLANELASLEDYPLRIFPNASSLCSAFFVSNTTLLFCGKTSGSFTIYDLLTKKAITCKPDARLTQSEAPAAVMSLTKYPFFSTLSPSPRDDTAAVSFWNLSNPARNRRLPVTDLMRRDRNLVAIMPSPPTLARVIDTDEGHAVHLESFRNKAWCREYFPFPDGHVTREVRLSDNGRFVVAAAEGAVIIWDRQALRETAIVADKIDDFKPSKPISLSFSSSGRYMLSHFTHKNQASLNRLAIWDLSARAPKPIAITFANGHGLRPTFGGYQATVTYLYGGGAFIWDPMTMDIFMRIASSPLVEEPLKTYPYPGGMQFVTHHESSTMGGSRTAQVWRSTTDGVAAYGPAYEFVVNGHEIGLTRPNLVPHADHVHFWEVSDCYDGIQRVEEEKSFTLVTLDLNKRYSDPSAAWTKGVRYPRAQISPDRRLLWYELPNGRQFVRTVSNNPDAKQSR